MTVSDSEWLRKTFGRGLDTQTLPAWFLRANVHYGRKHLSGQIRMRR